MTKRLLAFGLLLALGIVAVATQAALYAHNTPARHPDWVTSKLLLAEPVMGSTQQFTTRNLLARNRLNLEAWHGFNEVLSTRIGAVGRLRFRFRLAEGAYLYAVFDRTAAGFSALRLSRAERFPSAWFRATPDGRFLEARPIPDLAFSGSWHTAELQLGASDARLALDGAAIAVRGPQSAAIRQVIGFRSGEQPATVDDVVIEDAAGLRLVEEDFANRRGAAAFAVLVAALIAAPAAALAGFVRRGRVDARHALLLFTTCEIALLGVLGALHAFDFYLWSQRYPVREPWKQTAFDETLTRPEALRLAVVDRLPFVSSVPWGHAYPRELVDFLGVAPARGSWRWATNTSIRGPVDAQRIDEIEDTAYALRAAGEATAGPAALRILLLGTSQAWGSGAWHPRERIAARLQHHLAQALPGTEVAVFNASQRGSNSHELLARYWAKLHAVEPHVVIVQLSNNDIPLGFGRKLSAIVGQARSQSADVLFVLEANSPEVPDALSVRHAIMREIARSEGIGLADLHSHLGDAARYDSGILWWDRVHLTTWGQELAGRFIARAVLERVDRATPGR